MFCCRDWQCSVNEFSVHFFRVLFLTCDQSEISSDVHDVYVALHCTYILTVIKLLIWVHILLIVKKEENSKLLLFQMLNVVTERTNKNYFPKLCSCFVCLFVVLLLLFFFFFIPGFFDRNKIKIFKTTNFVTIQSEDGKPEALFCMVTGNSDIAMKLIVTARRTRKASSKNTLSVKVHVGYKKLKIQDNAKGSSTRKHKNVHKTTNAAVVHN